VFVLGEGANLVLDPKNVCSPSDKTIKRSHLICSQNLAKEITSDSLTDRVYAINVALVAVLYYAIHSMRLCVMLVLYLEVLFFLFVFAGICINVFLKTRRCLPVTLSSNHYLFSDHVLRIQMISVLTR